MPGGSKGSQTTTQQQKVEPWAAQQPYLQDVLSQAKNWYYGPNPIYGSGTQPRSGGMTPTMSTGSRSGASDVGSMGMPGSDYMVRTINPHTFEWGGPPVYYNADGTLRDSQTGTASGGGSGTGSGAFGDMMPDPNALPNFFPGSTVVPFAGETERALGMMSDTATNPNSLLGRAMQSTQGMLSGTNAGYRLPDNLAGDVTNATLRGDYLQRDNPLFRQMMEGVLYDVAPQVSGAFASAGRTGRSPLGNEALARGVTQGMLPYLESERSRQVGTSQAEIARGEAARQAGFGRQMAASQLAPQLNEYQIGLLSRAGQTRENQARNYLQEQIDRWNFEQNKPLERLQQYLGLISGNYGQTGTSSVTQPTYSNPLMSGLGMAATVGSLFAGPGGAGPLYGAFGGK